MTRHLVLEATCDTCGATNSRTLAEAECEDCAWLSMETDDGWEVDDEAVTCPECLPKGTKPPASALRSMLRGSAP